MLSERARKAFDELGRHPHVLDAARRLHPVWVAARGRMADRGVEPLAEEIARCIAAAYHAEDEKQLSDVFVGHGLIVIRGPGIDGFSVAVIAAEVFNLKLESVPPTPPPNPGLPRRRKKKEKPG